MPVISMVSTKGGAGKTTSCVVIGTELARFAKVLMIDTDPRQRVVKWSAKNPSAHENIKVERCLEKKELVQKVRAATNTYDYVLIDTEGAASERNAFAVNESDLIIVPMKDHQQDSEDAIDTIDEIESISESYRRKIPYRVLFTATKVVAKAKLQSFIAKSMREAYPVFDTELHDRTAFDAIMNSGTGLAGLDTKEISGVPEATENAISLIAELIAVLEENGTREVA